LIEDNAYTATIAYLKENEPTLFKEEYYRYRFGIPHQDPTQIWNFGWEFGIDRNLYSRTLFDSELTELDFGNKGKVSSRSKSYTKNSLRRRFPLRQRKGVKCLKIAQIQGRYRAARLQGGRC
jgi:hypothetical protein